MQHIIKLSKLYFGNHFTPSPSGASYGVPYMGIWLKIHRVITAPHCIPLCTDGVA